MNLQQKKKKQTLKKVKKIIMSLGGKNSDKDKILKATRRKRQIT